MKATFCNLTILFFAIVNPAVAAQFGKDQRPLEMSAAELSVAARLPAGLPVVLEVQIPNRADAPVSIWITGHGKYLPANRFAATLTDASGKTQTLKPSNGQNIQGAMTELVIQPGESLSIPLALPSQPIGKYRIEVASGLEWSGKAKMLPNLPKMGGVFEVVNDPALRQQWIDRYVNEARTGGTFAAWLGVNFDTEPGVALLNDLQGDDDKATANAAELLYLWYKNPLPKPWADAIETALRKHATKIPTTQAATDPQAARVVDRVLMLSSRYHLDRFSPWVVKLATRPTGASSDESVQALQGLMDSEATEALVRIMEQHKSFGSWNATWALASRGDLRALPELARLATEITSKRSGGRSEFELLVMFPDEKVAADAVEAGLHSSDPDIRASVERALRPASPMLWPKSVPGEMRPPPMTTQESAKLLLETEEFVLLDEQNAADPPQTVMAFRTVHFSMGSHAAANHLFNRANPCGRLYALCIFFMHSDKRLPKLAEQLSALNVEVTVIDGNKRLQVPIKTVVEHILSGEYPQQRLTKSY